MATKEKLLQELDELLSLIRSRSNSWFALTFLPPKLAERISEFSSKCLELKKEIIAADDDPTTLLDLQKSYLDLEIWAKRRVAKNNLLPTIFAIYLGFALLLLIFSQVDISDFVNKTLGVSAPEKLITLGVAGAFVYLATAQLSKIQSNSNTGQLGHVLDFSIRISLAIIVPIILVVLFFKPDGTIGEFAISPELTAFACGYSAKLVLVTFNKVVEKATQMIEVL